MAKVITQETFDAVVQENISEFEMGVEEAKKETIEQFEKQGINLANIIKDLSINEETGKPILNECVEKLKNYVENNSTEIDLKTTVNLLMTECCKSVPHRVYAAKNNTQEYLLTLMEAEMNKNEKFNQNSLLHCLILCAHALTNKNPDIFNGKSLEVILKLLDTQKDKHLICDILKWIQKACLLHENNRQKIMNEDILLKHLKPLLNREEPEIIRHVCTCFRYLVLDDDIRVEFGKAHEHARLIGQETLPDLTKLLTTFKNDQEVISELMLTIASLTVRNEFCVTVEEAGGLKFILDAMVEYPDSIKVVKESLKIVKALAGNDTVKANIIKNGAAPLVESALNRFKADENVAKHGLATVSTLALRNKDNSQALFETGIPETIVETMKIHEKNKIVQRNASWAIRNMVSRSRDQCETWISLGVEDVLNQSLQEHPSIAQDVKSALRDLGSDVHLNEEWKGKAEKVIQQ